MNSQNVLAHVVGLEIGGGPAPQKPGYLQFDAKDWKERTGLDYHLGDARELPYFDSWFDSVFASNLLEHFPQEETTAILTEWTRVLKIGGELELVVPDSMGILYDFFTGINTWDECEERLRGSMDYEGNEHYRAFTISTFPAVIKQVVGLQLIDLESSHRGGGVHAVCIKRR